VITKACANGKCPAYAHFVYTVAMRCVLCRCDLQPAQRSVEVLTPGVERRDAGGAAGLSRKSSRAHAMR
jgi:hypothetical protein